MEGVMVAENHRKSAIFIILTLLLVSTAYGQDTKNETSITTDTLEQHTFSEDSSQKESEDEPQISGGFFPIGQMHKVIREERTATLREIDKERKATLAYLTRERQAIVDALLGELERITDLMRSERRMTMVEMEAIGNRIAENAIFKSEKLIDHFFIRAFQFVLIFILFVGIMGFIIFRIAAKSKMI
jgi:hypothetical protein